MKYNKAEAQLWGVFKHQRTFALCYLPEDTPLPGLAHTVRRGFLRFRRLADIAACLLLFFIGRCRWYPSMA